MPSSGRPSWSRDWSHNFLISYISYIGRWILYQVANNSLLTKKQTREMKYILNVDTFLNIFSFYLYLICVTVLKSICSNYALKSENYPFKKTKIKLMPE